MNVMSPKGLTKCNKSPNSILMIFHLKSLNTYIYHCQVIYKTREKRHRERWKASCKAENSRKSERLIQLCFV